MSAASNQLTPHPLILFALAEQVSPTSFFNFNTITWCANAIPPSEEFPSLHCFDRHGSREAASMTILRNEV
jgi:hypothetical protein